MVAWEIHSLQWIPPLTYTCLADGFPVPSICGEAFKVVLSRWLPGTCIYRIHIRLGTHIQLVDAISLLSGSDIADGHNAIGVCHHLHPVVHLELNQPGLHLQSNEVSPACMSWFVPQHWSGKHWEPQCIHCSSASPAIPSLPPHF